MSSYQFTGPYPVTYPETKDAGGRNLGMVEPGDIREFGTPPDHQWVPAESGSGEGAPEPAEPEPEAPEPQPEPAAPEPAAEPAEPEPAPDGPQPAPPAVIPGT